MDTVRTTVYIIIVHLITLHPYKAYAQWVQVFDPNNGGNIHSIVMSGNNLVAGSDVGVYYSADRGATWTLSDLKSTINVFYIHGNKLYAGTQGAGAFLSTNQGENWSAINDGLTDKGIHSFAMHENTLFAGADFGLFSSTDDGKHWTTTSIIDNYVSSLIVSGNYIYAGLDVWISLSGNSVPKTRALGASVNNKFRNSGNTTVTGTYDNGVYRSSDNGINWVFTGLYNVPLSFVIKDSNLFAGTLGGVFHSSDSGKSWNSANSGLVSIYVNSLDVKSNNLFAGTDSGVFISTNNGISWRAVNSGLTSIYGKYIFALAVIGNDLFAGIAGSGLWRRPISEMIVAGGINSGNSKALSRFTLNQNYPNPFNPSTTISFFIPVQCFVSLKIFDLSGKEIKTFVSEILNPGTYSYMWNASEFASGIYFYHLQSDKFRQTKPLLLLK